MVKKEIPKKTKQVVPPNGIEKKPEEKGQTNEQAQTLRTKRVCVFCQTNSVPAYTDTSSLRRFVTDRGKIVPKLRSGVCSKHQRKVTKQIKYARHLALLPFTPKV